MEVKWKRNKNKKMKNNKSGVRLHNSCIGLHTASSRHDFDGYNILISQETKMKSKIVFLKKVRFFAIL